MNIQNWIVKILCILNKPSRFPTRNIIGVSAGIGKKEGMSEEESSRMFDYYFDRHEDIVFVKSSRREEVKKIIVDWASKYYSSDQIWCLLNTYDESSRNIWKDLLAVLDKEKKKLIREDIIIIILDLCFLEAEQSRLILNNKRVNVGNSFTVPTSNWSDQYPVRFFYDYAVRDRMFVYDGLNHSVSRFVELLIFLDESEGIDLLINAKHPS